MTDSAMPSESTPSAPIPPEPPATSPSSEPPPGGPVRYDNPALPAWARGKTFEEIVTEAQKIDARRAPAPPPSPAPMSTPNAPSPPDPQLIYTDPARYQREYDAYQEARFQERIRSLESQTVSVAANIYERQAASDREASQRDPRYADVWRRWPQEVEEQLASIPLAQRTRALYDMAAGVVKGAHVDEIAREQAEQLMAAGGVGTERAGGQGGGFTGGASVADDIDTLWETDAPYVRKMREEGLTPSMVRDQLRKWKVPVEEFVKNATADNIITTPAGIVRRSA